MTSRIGTQVAGYRIESLLSRGGIGEYAWTHRAAMADSTGSSLAAAGLG